MRWRIARLAVLVAVCSCSERSVEPMALENEGATLSNAKSVASLVTCGAQFTTVATLSIAADQYEPASAITDTVTSCMTWTGSDYTNSVTVSGTSEVNALHDPRGTYSFGNATVTGPTDEGPLSMPTEATTALDFVNASTQVRAAVAADPYFMFRSCPLVMPPPPEGGIGGPPILPAVDEDIYWDPCGAPAGLRFKSNAKSVSAMQVDAARQKRSTAQDSLIKGLRRVARVEMDGTIRYTGFDDSGAAREVRMHPTARIPLSEVRRSGLEYGRTDFEWRRTSNGFVRVGERVTEDILQDGRLVRVYSTIRHRAIRIQID